MSLISVNQDFDDGLKAKSAFLACLFSISSFKCVIMMNKDNCFRWMMADAGSDTPMKKVKQAGVFW